ncbi:heat-inducible transcriptional repressor HrcA [Plasticicumulans sp.]|uniref:heat-inducible transcriptional repressor HrcA n=1 Tax=Plasticicumulans sp. TaxID=2307179 RepID=UPI000F91797A|nr:heat-inducible transcriptional repressor HrcA [Plasticicumulans sp.]MBS0601450.1 heat-inducible transcriptional repressor HrcA [Pseudomonadota bacterium]RTK95300.1 MAG: heat-inducible transcriptional repressor HrcA [Xanthomonadales bacterium]HMV38067.1 heat-inducible transcriptional repressor HrcA [Plasticicumulans sp.]HMW28308.1 heat-inducible transcriptional repressor HrcA [Plasticicumulans sp.]HMW41804.1 heat-inducible transcriptional repressor HrcA [Plasticicumulans sp.]
MARQPVPASQLSDRAQLLLKALVQRYIEDGQPVGSRTLAKNTGMDLSPATIRNVMSDLEELGFLRAPHTSAGRVPTVRGYRFFVDTLMQVRPLENAAVQSMERELRGAHSTHGLVQSASTLLSGLSHMAGIVMIPRRDSVTLRQIEFLPLSERRVLAIIVVNEREVQNRILHVSRDYTRTELTEAANYLNRLFAGHDLQQVRAQLLAELQAAELEANDLLQRVAEMAEQALSPEARELPDDFVLAGQTNLMGFSELADVQRLRGLFEAFTHKRDLLGLFDQCLRADGVQIYIGDESGYEVLDECSVIAAPYGCPGQTLGVLGIIGPTRMAYERVVPLVDVTAKLLSAALNSQA